ncbi:ABC transporter permease [Georgenia subflava]|uniref:ABC transporter permease n=1 Tax=Georgenia subflava TaxID=1622177 RepID=A0A6N7ED70_9MICO|nr:ABC transporter permease [Georgenia subflava]MPV36362.1 ABC transporter permease [Georgenia subflava]
MTVALELGILYAVMALGVYLTFRILDFPDLTVDGSFTTGGATAAALIISGTDPLVATAAAVAAGLAAGVITGLLHTKGGINGLLAGILTQIALYSVNLRIMGKANLPLLREDTLMTPLRENDLMGTATSIGIFAAVVVVVLALLVCFLHTDMGLALQATGDNGEMIRSFGVSTNRMKVLGLALSNGLVAGCGALITQYQGFADIGMGIGLIVAGLASVIIGQAILGQRTIFVAALAAVLGSVAYRGFIQLALYADLDPNDMKLISAVLVVAALVLPRWSVLRRFRRVRGVRTSGTTREPAAVEG